MNGAALYRLPFGQVFGGGVAYGAIGALQGMLDEFLAFAHARVRSGGRTTVLDPDAQQVVAEAENAIDELTAIVRRNVANLTAYAERGEVPPDAERLKYKFQMATVCERCRGLAARIASSRRHVRDRIAVPLRPNARRHHLGAAAHHQPARNARPALGRAPLRRRNNDRPHAIDAARSKELPAISMSSKDAPTKRDDLFTNSHSERSAAGAKSRDHSKTFVAMVLLDAVQRAKRILCGMKVAGMFASSQDRHRSMSSVPTRELSVACCFPATRKRILEVRNNT